jgi:hypothetical protein
VEIAEAKQRLKIPELWRAFGYAGEPKQGVQKAPWRDDKSPSWSYDAKQGLFNDFAEGIGGDAIVFIERALGLNRKDATKKFMEMAGGASAGDVKGKVYAAPIEDGKHGRKFPELPELHPGADFELEQLSEHRGISIEALQHAQKLGILWFCKWKGFNAWMVTDASRVNAQVRRLDGGLWQVNREGATSEMKSWTLPGSWASYPVGICNARGECKEIYLTEGAPDLLAACQFAKDDASIIPVGMLGASADIHDGALPMFDRKFVTIFMHNEKPKPVLKAGKWVTPEKSAGRIAADKWTARLEGKARAVKVYQFPEGIKDLNDYVKQFQTL